VALSGGADSVALLRILCDLGYHIEAAHCNFHLRGEESDRDEQFVKNLCNTLHVPLHLIHFDTASYAALHQVSIEMAARDLRYGYFRQLHEDIGAETVCVAHHRDDAVETLLMNLLRGAGIHGLTGIRPCNGYIVRPLLGVSRQEIEEYLHSIGQVYVTDSTNLQAEVLRNKVRLQLIPLMERLSPGASDNIARSAYYLSEAEKVYNSAWDINTDTTLPIHELMASPSPLCFLHEWLTPFGFNRSQMEQIITHLDGESGRVFESSTHTLVIDRDRLVVEPVSAPIKPHVIPESGNYRLTDNLSLKVKFTDDISISKLDNCATLDKEKISFPLTVRPIQSGDSFCPFGMEGHKLVSDFLTDCKRSVLEKRRQLVVTDAKGDILWLVGLRVDHRYRITPQTTSVLCLKLVRSE
jgi:tRNA(Ile)-lysidine synthase